MQLWQNIVAILSDKTEDAEKKKKKEGVKKRKTDPLKYRLYFAVPDDIYDDYPLQRYVTKGGKDATRTNKKVMESVDVGYIPDDRGQYH